MTTLPRHAVWPLIKPLSPSHSFCPAEANVAVPTPSPHPIPALLGNLQDKGLLFLPGGAVGIDLFQQDGLLSPSLPPRGQHLQHCPIIGAEEQDGDVTVGTSRAIHSYLGQ